MKQIIAWMFDIDGVVTNPETKQVERREIIDFMVERLQKGDPVALITGRALPWVRQRVLPLLQNKVQTDTNLLNNLYVSGEFGGAYITWKDGIETTAVDRTIQVPENIANEAKKAAGLYKNSHFIDPDKQTMVSLEMNDGMKVDDFKPQQHKLAQILESILVKYGKQNQFEVHMDRIATNIRDKRANKYYAAQQVAEWIGNKQIQPQEYITFGDSAGDTEMSSQLHKMGLNTRLVFVGGKSHVEGMNFDFPVVITGGHCDEGVVEFISEFRTKESSQTNNH